MKREFYNEFYHTDGSKKATYSGRIVLGQLVELHAEAMMDGKKMKFASFLLALDEKNFMKPEVTIEKENINKYLVGLTMM